MRTIKRYANRKLYDTTDSKYVTLADIGALAQAGELLSVVDNKSKSDITLQTLALAIAADQGTGSPRYAVTFAELVALIQGGFNRGKMEALASVKAEATQALEDATVKTGAPLDFGS
jgi:polyhydroxyalkanoate synthesis repressor PhaR